MHPRLRPSSLRLLGSGGRAHQPGRLGWYQHVGGGRCPIVDTFWQTETGGRHDHAAAGRDNRPGPPARYLRCPSGHHGRHRRRNGQRYCPMVRAASWSKPWPSMIRTISRTASRRATTRPSSGLPPRGRRRHPRRPRPATSSPAAHDVLNVSGHRMGTMEIESALVGCTRTGG